MPGYADQFSPAQLETLLRYVTGLASGEVAPPEKPDDLPPVIFRCAQQALDPICNTTMPEPGGN
jgi:hypothetical protein